MSRLKKLRELANHGNQDAIALVEGNANIPDLAGCKVLAAAGDEEAVQHLERLRGHSRLQREKYKARVMAGDPDALAVKQKKANRERRKADDRRAKLAAGDSVAIAARGKARAASRREREAKHAKVAAGDPDAVAKREKARANQRRIRAEQRAYGRSWYQVQKTKRDAGDPKAIAAYNRRLESNRNSQAKTKGTATVRIVEGFGYIRPSRDDEEQDDGDEDDEEDSGDDEDGGQMGEDELADWMAGSGREWPTLESSKLTRHKAEKAKRDAGDADAIAKYQKQLAYQRQYTTKLKERAAAGDADAAEKLDRRKGQSRQWLREHGGTEYSKAKAEERSALRMAEGFDWDGSVQEEDADGEGDDEGEAEPPQSSKRFTGGSHGFPTEMESSDDDNEHDDASDITLTAQECVKFEAKWNKQLKKVEAEIHRIILETELMRMKHKELPELWTAKEFAKMEAELKSELKQVELEMQRLALELELLRLRRKRMMEEDARLEAARLGEAGDEIADITGVEDEDVEMAETTADGCGRTAGVADGL